MREIVERLRTIKRDPKSGVKAGLGSLRATL
jgi:hypothetical protein